MERTHETMVAAQFGPRARDYVQSAVHAQGADLEVLANIVSAAAPERALDIGAGGGHVSYLMARYAAAVTALDLSTQMLAAVAATAREKGLANIETVEGPAERLPFADGCFDFLASRYSAHHWRDFNGGLREARRVLKPGRSAVFVDVYAPARPLFDTHLQAVELLRDPSHVRNYTIAEWTVALATSGFTVERLQTWRLRMDFAVWVARMRTPQENQRAIRALQAAASGETREHFAIETDGSFLIDVMMIEVRAASW
ncbi:class I SAM-dependent methyltransferase [Methylocystis sp. MJC1]|jgi:SAM-dependent methyltransferase|uniref:class I SAM-dependent methyltransferase n=1 Tax=Methylocystis sp. MJC1 TaxID=2654282 RepID=UPI0013ED7EDD|nr:class I SAM-dependent methyltransferase [Methylocystis sp. MJC1]KAF2991647.1 putative methyltransferase YcgJ [Methylocystis sp. MJC1]MBU6527114.1 class I SAM-dependent methyltransferase [Methylocystis sp. MJC1]UZX13550.1 class I SAM-dependent methyltransferase [Methylocystis sp. MJC1]